MLTNGELFAQNPAETKIPNDGVAQVGRPTTPEQWEVLRWELQSFVCEGQYERGLERVLASFLANLAQAKQPAAWVSGFYGSGKSHLVRVLECLWRDVELADGTRARALATLPDDIRDHLVELSNAGRRAGGLWSAAGTPSTGKARAPRLAFLSVIFGSARLPSDYTQARFVIWARKNGYLDAVEAAVRAAGRSLESELHHLYVSPYIAKPLHEADRSLGASISEVRKLLEAQFPPTEHDLNDQEMFAVMEDVLKLSSTDPQSTAAARLPLTLIVLDEMQQYINDENAKALAIQNIVEGCSARFHSQVLFVATGQSALTASPTLSKLTDRFTVQVALSDNDIETVMREVVLRKRPEHKDELKVALDAVSGEIDRQLGGTQLAPRAADKDDLVADYPLLPTRRRFWEQALRAIDPGGTAGLLRSQLRIVHEAARAVAGKPMGHVVGADFLYGEQSTGMQASGVLPKEIDDFIRGLQREPVDGHLQSRICALVFLISKLAPQSIGGETGLRATTAYLADLLVEDLANDGGTLRKRVPELLEALVAAGKLQRIGDEYRLQTQEGSVWEQEYRRALAVARDDLARLSQLRDDRLRQAFEAVHARIALKHGASRMIRKISWHWGEDAPSGTDADVPVWVRDEWSVTDAAVKRSAAEASEESPVVFVLLLKREADQVKEASASWLAAAETLRQPTPQTEGGRDAQRAMRSRLESDEDRLGRLLDDVVRHARVFSGGGAEVSISTLGSSLETAASRSLVRLFPKFGAGDNASWDKVVAKAHQGAPDALVAIGYQGEPTARPVCKEVMARVSPGGTKGADLQRQLTTPPYGWPRDAVNAAILVLLAAGNIRATRDGRNLGGPTELSPSQVGKVTLFKEDEPPTISQRLDVRGLLSAAGIAHQVGEEDTQVPALLQRLKDLAARAGGAPPLPEPPATGYIDTIGSLGGNQRFRAVADAHEALHKDLTHWRAASTRRDKREAEWRDLVRLLRHADGLAVAASVKPAVDAIRDGRQLLDEPDPLAPLLGEVAGAVRAELALCAEQHDSARVAALAELEARSEWQSLDPSARQPILDQAQLTPLRPADVSSASLLIEALDATSLSGWRDRIEMVGNRGDQARQAAAKLAEPASVKVGPPAATLRTQQDLEDYVAELRSRVQPHLDAHRVVII